MLDFTLSGKAYFDTLPQPVLLIRAEKTEYCNPAAQALFRVQGRPLRAGDPRPDSLPVPDSGSSQDSGSAPDSLCAATLSLKGQNWSVTVQTLEAGTLYRLAPLSEHDGDQMRNVSAQLRLLLSRAGLSVEALQEELSETEQLRSRAAVARLNHSLCQLLRLSDHLDLYARNDEDLLLLHPACSLDLEELCRNLAAQVEPLAAQLGSSFVFEGQTLFVRVNPTLLERVLLNLCSNAMKAGGDLRLRLRRRENSAVLTLTDNGGGIAPVRLPMLFTPSSRPEGLSMGLPLCRRIVQLYGGQMVVSPGPNATAVSLSLPLCKPGNALNAPQCAAGPEPGFGILLTELSDVLGPEYYTQEDLL